MAIKSNLPEIAECAHEGLLRVLEKSAGNDDVTAKASRDLRKSLEMLQYAIDKAASDALKRVQRVTEKYQKIIQGNLAHESHVSVDTSHRAPVSSPAPAEDNEQIQLTEEERQLYQQLAFEHYDYRTKKFSNARRRHPLLPETHKALKILVQSYYRCIEIPDLTPQKAAPQKWNSIHPTLIRILENSPYKLCEVRRKSMDERHNITFYQLVRR